MKVTISILTIFIGLTCCTSPQQVKEELDNTDTLDTHENKKEIKIETSKYERSFSKEGNIFIVSKAAISKQITFSARDSYPILDKKENKVFFFRAFRFMRDRKVGFFKTETDTFNKYSLMSVELEKLTEEIITDRKPFNSQDPDGEIYIINQPTLDPGGNHIYFTTGKYATGDELVKVNLRTGEWKELFPSNYYERILSINYLGYFFSGQSAIEERGRDIYYRLIDPDGKIVKKFDSKTSMEAFKLTQNIVCQNPIDP
jgi:hypothetical protein